MNSPAGRSRKRKGSGGERRVLMLAIDNAAKIDPSLLVRFEIHLADGIVGLERSRVGKLGAVISVVVRGESKRHWRPRCACSVL